MRSLSLTLVAFALLWSGPASAHSFTKDHIKVGHPWTRATPAGAVVAAGYLTVTNSGEEDDRLLGGTFESAGSVEVHEMTMTDGVMRMRGLKDGLAVKAGKTVELKPGSTHMMFLGLENAIATGPKIKGTLRFEKAGEIAVEYKVEPIGATESHDHDSHDHEGHGDKDHDHKAQDHNEHAH